MNLLSESMEIHTQSHAMITERFFKTYVLENVFVYQAMIENKKLGDLIGLKSSLQ